MPLIQGKQINLLVGVTRRIQSAFSIVTGTSAYTTTVGFSGAAGGGTDTTAGVFTASPQNYSRLIRRDNSRELATAAGTRIFGRNTLAGSTYTTTLYTTDLAGGESIYTPVAGDNINGVSVDMIYGLSVQAVNIRPTDITNLLLDVDNIDASGGVQPIGRIDTFNATAGQTSFNLSFAPRSNTLFGFVNGQEINDRISVSGTTVTYTATDFALAVGDYVVFKYTN